MMEIRLKSTFLELLFVCLCLLTVLGPANGETVTVTEGSDAVLPCFIYPERNITHDVFDWKKGGQEVFFYVNGGHCNNGRTGQDEQFKGRVSHFPDQLLSGDASIVIRNITVSDSGTYTCDYSPDDETNRQTFTIELIVEGVVVKVDVGSDAVLRCFIRPERDIRQDVFDWRKDALKEVFFYENGSHYNNGREGQVEQFKGRVFHFPDQLQSGDASIRINNTKPSDSGTYTCDYSPDEPNRQTFDIELIVVSAVVKVKEGSEAVLPCFISPKRNIRRDYFYWLKDRQEEVFFYMRGMHYGRLSQVEQFKGRVSHFPDQLQSGDASIRINNTKLSDSGTYTCDYSPDEPNSQTFNIELVVDCILKDRSEENIRGASQVHVMFFKQTKDKVQLQCEVQGASPKPKVKWQDSDGNILPAEEPQVTERGGSYDIILNTTVTKTDKYHCVVTQEDICHQVSAVAFLYIDGSSTGWLVAGVFATLFFVAVLAVLYITRHRIQRCIRGPQTAEGDPSASDKQELQPLSVSTDGDRDDQRAVLRTNRKKNETRKTGGGAAPPHYTAPEELALANNEGRPIMEGIGGGLQSDPCAGSSQHNLYVQVEGDTMVLMEPPAHVPHDPSPVVDIDDEDTLSVFSERPTGGEENHSPQPTASTSRQTKGQIVGADTIRALYKRNLEQDNQKKELEIKKLKLEIGLLESKTKHMQQ